MNPKKILRGPFIWVLLFMLFVFGATRLMTGSGPVEIDTSEGLELLRGDTVEQVEITDGYQRVNLALTEEYKGADEEDKGKLVQFYYAAPQGPEVVQAVADADPEKGYNSVVPQTPWWSSVLMTMLSIILLVGVFWFLLSRMQGGGARMMSVGRSKAKQRSEE